MVTLDLLRFVDGGRDPHHRCAAALSQAFSRPVADPRYQQVTQLCMQALTEAVLQPTSPW